MAVDYNLNRRAQSVAVLRPDGPTPGALAAINDAELAIVDGVVSPWPENLGPAPTEAEIAETDPFAYHVTMFWLAIEKAAFKNRKRSRFIPPEYFAGVCQAWFTGRLAAAITHPALAALQVAAGQPVKTEEQVYRASLDAAAAIGNS